MAISKDPKFSFGAFCVCGDITSVSLYFYTTSPKSRGVRSQEVSTSDAFETINSTAVLILVLLTYLCTFNFTKSYFRGKWPLRCCTVALGETKMEQDRVPVLENTKKNRKSNTWVLRRIQF